ncbi:MAG: FixH family protein [Deltaproteobacteria bacterium]|nr:FixH family protein [Deltaproteobacteria bacterium]
MNVGPWMTTSLRGLATLGLAGALAACGGGTPAEPDAFVDCSTDSRAEVFTAGMTKAGSQGSVTFKLMSATPVTPSRGLNAWQLDLVDGGGAAIAGAAVKVTPYMPDHQHDAGVTPVVTEPTAGHYQLDMINLWMPGVWQTTIEATPAGGAKDVAVFSFCIQPG